MKSKNLLIGLGILCLNAVAYAQGLEGIVVEKYYKANSADVANAIENGAVTPLTTGSVTYRIYVDMASGYKFNSLFGSTAHNLKVNSTAGFYNDPTFGVSINPGTISSTNIRKETAMLDSYFTTGGAGGGKVGVLKTEDNDGSIGNAQGVLANNPGGCFGLPITGTNSQDGMMPLTISPATYIGPNLLGSASSLDVLDQINGNAILLTAHAIAALGGVYGPTSTNMVLVAQFTTSGDLTFELNLQLQNTTTGAAENYVASNPTGNELTHASLTRGIILPPAVLCYQTATFNEQTCTYDITGTQQTNTTTVSVCDPYTWNGTTYTTSGVYTGPIVNCTIQSLNLTITPSSTNTTTASAVGTYTWNGQTYTTSGVYTGTTVNCVTPVLNLTILPEYKVLSASSICSETLYQVPVATSSPYSVNDVKGYDVVINYDATKLVPTGNVTITNELINSTYVESTSSIPSPGVLNLTINLNGSAPSSAEFNGAGTIFNVGFTKLAGFNAIDSSIVSVPFMQESYITGVQAKSVKSAKMYSTAIQSYTGNLVFWSDSSPITYNSASPSSALITNIYGSTGSPVTPNQNGQFTSNLSSGLDLSIQRDIINENSVQAIVNAADAVLGKTLLIDGAFTPSVYQIIALDVNLDGVVSAGDISQMKQRTTLSIPEYMQSWNYNNQGVSNGSPSKDWIFVDNARIATPAYLISGTFPANDNIGFSKARVPQVPFILPMVVSNYNSNNSTCPTVGTETYKGIMLGDVNGSYASYTADGLLKSEDALITIDLSQAVINGNKVTVPVVITSDEPVNALDLAFEFNESKLSFDNVSELAQNIEAESFFNQNDRTFRYSAYTLENFKLNQSVALISFESTDGTINKKDFHSLMGLLNGKPVDVSFEKAGITSSILDRISIYPNPSNGNFTVVSSEDVNIEILEMSGKLLKEVSVKSNQEQAINLDNVTAGVYLIRVFNQNSSSTQRIVIAK